MNTHRSVTNHPPPSIELVLLFIQWESWAQYVNHRVIFTLSLHLSVPVTTKIRFTFS